LANLLKASFVELGPIPYAPVEAAHVDDVEQLTMFLEECPFGAAVIDLEIEVGLGGIFPDR